jgi:3-hydroxyacyl-CoA dehydrogenase
VLPEKGAFILNKAFIYFQGQSFRFFRENILSFREIDALIRKHIFAMGTFEFLDQVGLDVILFATEHYLQDLEYPEMLVVLVEEVSNRVREGNLGVKSGKGFYAYDKEKSQDEAPPLKQVGPEERKRYEDEVVNKLICIYLNSTYDFVDKGYCTESEIETALAGYNGMEKGPVSLCDTIGAGKVCDLLMNYYRETGERVYYPSPSLRRRAEAGKE